MNEDNNKETNKKHTIEKSKLEDMTTGAFIFVSGVSFLVLVLYIMLPNLLSRTFLVGFEVTSLTVTLLLKTISTILLATPDSNRGPTPDSTQTPDRSKTQV